MALEHQLGEAEGDLLLAEAAQRLENVDPERVRLERSAWWTSDRGPAFASDPLRDEQNVIEDARGHRHHELVRFVVVEREAQAVEAQEGERGGRGESLVAVDEGVVASQEAEQCGGLEADRGDVAEANGALTLLR